ncbi:MAG: hypothetical protein K0R54_1764 [Clostridiaceae bacterium]|jgi:hypothetical protein|nr:hypothetical protein [Clostridiaceae bacterium]
MKNKYELMRILGSGRKFFFFEKVSSDYGIYFNFMQKIIVIY